MSRADGWAWGNNGLTWRAMILPQPEQSTTYNAFNFSIHADGSAGSTAAWATVWYTVNNV